jgi:uncharacterized membrane protein
MKQPTGQHKVHWLDLKMDNPNDESIPESGLQTPRSYIQFVLTHPTTSWFKLSMVVVGINLLSFSFASGSLIFMAAKAVTGAVILLLLPGLATQRLISAGQPQNTVETVAFSIGISVIVTIILSVVANFSPFGLAAAPILLVVVLYIVTVSMFAIRKEFQCLHTNTF